MQGENKKAKSRGGKRVKERLGPDRSDRIDEYNFFLARDEEAPGEGVPEGDAIRKKKNKNNRNKSMTFFLSE